MKDTRLTQLEERDVAQLVEGVGVAVVEVLVVTVRDLQANAIAGRDAPGCHAQRDVGNHR